MSVARQRRSYVPTLRLGGLWKPSDARFRREIDRFRWISMDFRWIFDGFSAPEQGLSPRSYLAGLCRVIGGEAAEARGNFERVQQYAKMRKRRSTKSFLDVF